MLSFLALAQGLPFAGHATEGEMDSPPVLFHIGSELGQSYISAMQLAGEDKPLDAVLAAHGDTIEVVHRLTPLGVAMAAAETYESLQGLIRFT